MKKRVGNVTKVMQVICIKCYQQYQESVPDNDFGHKGKFIKTIQGKGWGKRRGIWLCPSCNSCTQMILKSLDSKPKQT